MAIVILADTPGMTRDIYEDMRGELGLGGSGLPDGCQVHIAGEAPDGSWRVVTVWESEVAAQAFQSERLIPTMQRHGVTWSPTAPQMWEAHNVLTA